MFGKIDAIEIYFYCAVNIDMSFTYFNFYLYFLINTRYYWVLLNLLCFCLSTLHRIHGRKSNNECFISDDFTITVNTFLESPEIFHL